MYVSKEYGDTALYTKRTEIHRDGLHDVQVQAQDSMDRGRVLRDDVLRDIP